MVEKGACSLNRSVFFLIANFMLRSAMVCSEEVEFSFLFFSKIRIRNLVSFDDK